MKLHLKFENFLILKIWKDMVINSYIVIENILFGRKRTGENYCSYELGDSDTKI